MEQQKLDRSHGTAPRTWSTCNCGVYPNLNHGRKFPWASSPLQYSESMSNSRRQFFNRASAVLMTALTACRKPTPNSPGPSQSTTPGAPTAFGTAPDVGPLVSTATFAEAEKLVQFELSPAERETAAGNWRSSMAPLYERRTGPRKFSPPPSAPASRWDPLCLTQPTGPDTRSLRSTRPARGSLFPLTTRTSPSLRCRYLSRWIETRQLTSERLTRLYLDRLQRFDPKLRCVITLTRDLALSQAQQADREIAAGHYRGPLHGIPWGAKDLLDTAGIPTTYGAEPYRNRVPTQDAAVVKRLHDAGAVLVAKLSLGALALNDIWFGGQTMNPWLLEEGASGSSAGPGAATAAGLVGFSIGSETGGSIVESLHALRRHGLSAHLRPRAAHWRDDAVLVARQTRPHDARSGGRAAGVAGDLRPRPRRCRQRPEPPRFRRFRSRYRAARRLLPRLDEGSSRHRCRSRGARNRSQTRHGSNRGVASRLAVRFAQPDSLRRSRRRIRGTHARRAV